MKLDEDITKVENSPFFIGRDGIDIDNYSPLNQIPISSLGFNIRFYHIINANKYKYLTDVLNTDYNLMLSYRNCGVKSIASARMEIRFFVREFYLQNKRNVMTNNFSQINNTILSSSSMAERSKLKSISGCPVQKLKLPIKARRFLTNNSQIKTLGDLINIDKTKLEKNFGFNVFVESQKVITDLLKEEEKELKYLYSDQLIPILELVNLFLERIEKRDLNIIIKRWENKDITSLQLIAEKYGLTRERIRQIISGILIKFKEKIKNNYNFYAEQFLAIIISNPEPITFEELNDHLFLERKFKSTIYLGILSEVFEEIPFSNFELKSFDQYLNRNFNQNTKISVLYKKLLKSKYPFKKITLEKLFLLNNVNELVDKLLISKIVILSQNFKFIFLEGKYYIIKSGTLNENTIDILESNDEPLEINSIVGIIKMYYTLGNKYDSINSIISNIKQSKDIYQLDRYVFGLEKHFSYPREQWKNICKSVKELINKLQRQTNAVELYEKVLPLYPKLRSKYELVYIIRSDPDIVDLGFFNFGLVDFSFTERLKISDVIRNVFLRNPSPKHTSEIHKKILEQRFSHIGGMNSILNSQEYLFNYSGNFFGLREKHRENLIYLANKETYIANLIDYELFPDSVLSRIIVFFEDIISTQQLIDLIKNSRSLSIYNDNNFLEQFVISKKWTIIKIIRCILFNSNEPMYWEELIWLLKDKGLSVDNSDKYRIKNNKYIRIKDNKLSYINIEIQSEDSKAILNECYNLLLNTSEIWTFERLNSFINKEYIEIDLNQLEFLLKNDDRFIIIENKIIVTR